VVKTLTTAKGLSLTSFSLLVTWLWMIHRYIRPPSDEREKVKVLPDANIHAWKKTNLLATSQLLKELADRAIVKDKQTKPELHVTQDTDGSKQSGLPIKSDKIILPFSAASNNNGVMSTVSLVEQPDTTAEKNNEGGGIAVQQQSTEMSYERSSERSSVLHDVPLKSNMARPVLQQRSNSLPNKTYPEQSSNVGKTIVDPRRYSLPNQITQIITR
jgi:hypothetical protein